MPLIATANIKWLDGVPFNVDYSDIYASPQQPFAESDYVFIKANKLRERWQQTPAYSFFTIGETGFGCGINFVLASALWLEATKHQPCRLNFVSCELHPWSHQDLKLFWERPNITAQLGKKAKEITQQLLKAYPLPLAGWHRLIFAGGKISLSIFYGEAAKAWGSQTRNLVDCWFLDGFAPAKNPQMWREELFAKIKQSSRSGCTFATFSSASKVRHLLTNCGFVVAKGRGFGHKREMLCGYYQGEHNKPQRGEPQVVKRNKIAVIGGGLSGITSALALQQKFYKTKVFEQEAKVGQSLIPQMALHCNLHALPGIYNDLLIKFMSYASAYWDFWGGEFWQPSSLLQLAPNASKAQKYRKIMQWLHNDEYARLVQKVDAKTASTLSGIPIDTAALHFPQSGSLQSARWARLVANKHIDSSCATKVTQIKRGDSTVELYSKNNSLGKFDAVVVANSWQVGELLPEVKANALAGQQSYFEDASGFPLNCILCSDKTVFPAFGKGLRAGSTYHHCATLDKSKADDESNKNSLLKITQQNAAKLYPILEQAAVGIRSTRPTRLPLLGSPARGVFVNVAHGSRGLCTTPLSAELIAQQVATYLGLNEASLLEQEIIGKLEAQNFIHT